MKIKAVVLIAILLCVPLFVLAQNYPRRIVSLGPSITEDIYLLGAGDRLVANTTYCMIPPEAAGKEKIGTITAVDIEKLLSLNPDMVLATPLTNPRTKDKIEKMGIKIVSSPLAKNFDELCMQFAELGKLIGRGKEARKIIETARKKTDSIRAVVRKLPRTKVFIQVGSRPLFTMTRDSFVNDFIERAGGINIAFDAKSGLYSREKVIEQDPDVILIMEMGIAGEEEKKIWLRYDTLSAVKNSKIFFIDAYKIGSPTPVSFIRTLEELTRMLHPENTTYSAGQTK